jgi:hypothetical protein
LIKRAFQRTALREKSRRAFLQQEVYDVGRSKIG